MNTAIEQQVNKKEAELGRSLTMEEYDDVKAFTLQTVRGTVQADILKEDQGQNTCIFFNRVRTSFNGRYSAIFYRSKGAKLLLCFHFWLSYRRSRS